MTSAAKFLRPFSLLLFLAAAACGSTSKPVPPDFANDPQHPKLFFYATYADGAERPDFDETFILRVDGVLINDITADKYLETDLPPDNHAFDVEEIAWSGYSRGHARLTEQTKGNIFIMEQVLPDDEALLSAVPADEGEKEVSARTRKCLCGTMLRRYMKDF